ncbi:MAG: 2-oxo acid dehydrogenase subunit E2 [Anaerolineae bacterium]|nr:2-oxo acid dehydrogenase subunit E2 [Anaerolineae bacterium]
MAEFLMPSLGADMESAALVGWLKKPGDTVKRGDVIAEVEADKGVFEVQIFEDGVIDHMLVQPSDVRLAVGTPLAVIRAVGEPVVEQVAPARAEQAAHVQAPGPGEVRPAQPPAPVPPPVTPVERRIRVSPLARKLAVDLGVDLETVQGTGPNGAIERIDVEHAAEANRLAAKAPPAPPVVEKVVPPAPVAEQPSAAPPAVEKAPAAPPAAPAQKPKAGDQQAAMRRAIAAAMSRANREIPHYYLETRIDMSRALRWLEEENLKRSIKQRILPAALLIKAVAKGLADVPELNGFWLDDQHVVSEAIHIGFAISLRQGGLIAPAIHDADLKNLDELMEALHDLIARTRSGGLRSSEMTDATITLTNLGDMGVETVYGVIYPPQVALVGFGKVTDHTWVENGMIGIRPVLTATLAADHRASDGRKGALFLDALNKYLQEADKL